MEGLAQEAHVVIGRHRGNGGLSQIARRPPDEISVGGSQCRVLACLVLIARRAIQDFKPWPNVRLVISAAVRLLEGLYRQGFNYVKAGVMLVELQLHDQVQGELDLFSGVDAAPEAAPQRDPSKLRGALDALNQRFGKGAVTVASALRQEASSASGVKSKQEWRSPRYTTRVAEIPTARA